MISRVTKEERGGSTTLSVDRDTRDRLKELAGYKPLYYYIRQLAFGEVTVPKPKKNKKK